MTFDSRKGAAESLRQLVKALVRIGVPKAYDLAVIDLAIPARDPGHGVEVLRFHCDVQPPPNQSTLGRCGAGDIACNVIFDDRTVKAVSDQRAFAAGGLGKGDQGQLSAP